MEMEQFFYIERSFNDGDRINLNKSPMVFLHVILVEQVTDFYLYQGTSNKQNMESTLHSCFN
jgi:hypothetical protein